MFYVAFISLQYVARNDKCLDVYMPALCDKNYCGKLHPKVLDL